MAARASDVKLVAHRWDMHVIQALASGDHELLLRVFKELQLPSDRDCVNTKIKTFGCGAPAQLHSYVGGAAPLLEHVEDGDTLLLIALRSCDAQCALALINVGASLYEANNIGETPIQLIFQAYAKVRQSDKQQLSDPSSSQQQQRTEFLQSRGDRIIAKRSEFASLFARVQDSIDRFYGAMKAKIRSELEAIYTEFAPERMSKVERQMADFEFDEQALLEGVRRKYTV